MGSLSGSPVVVDIKFNPFAGLLGKGSYTGIELILSLAENIDIFGLFFGFKCFQLSFVHFLPHRLESTTCLPHDD